MIFHGIAVKPGKPTAFAIVDGVPFLGRVRVTAGGAQLKGARRITDALVQAAQLVARMGTTGPTGTDARVNLILPIESLTHATGEGATAGSDERGTPLMPATARLLSCCATVTPIWVDTDGRPLHVGRAWRERRGTSRGW